MRHPLKYILLALLFFLAPLLLLAQDALPVAAALDKSIVAHDSLARYGELQDTLPLPLVPIIPNSFQQMQENLIVDTLGILAPFWEKVRQLRRKKSGNILPLVIIIVF